MDEGVPRRTVGDIQLEVDLELSERLLQIMAPHQPCRIRVQQIESAHARSIRGTADKERVQMPNRWPRDSFPSWRKQRADPFENVGITDPHSHRDPKGRERDARLPPEAVDFLHSGRGTGEPRKDLSTLRHGHAVAPCSNRVRMVPSDISDVILSERFPCLENDLAGSENPSTHSGVPEPLVRLRARPAYVATSPGYRAPRKHSEPQPSGRRL